MEDKIKANERLIGAATCMGALHVSWTCRPRPGLGADTGMQAWRVSWTTGVSGFGADAWHVSWTTGVLGFGADACSTHEMDLQGF